MGDSSFFRKRDPATISETLTGISQDPPPQPLQTFTYFPWWSGFEGPGGTLSPCCSKIKEEMDISFGLIMLWLLMRCSLCLTHIHTLSLPSVCFILEKVDQKGSAKGLAKVQLPSHMHTHALTHTHTPWVITQPFKFIYTLKLKTNLCQRTQIQGYTHALAQILSHQLL